MKTTTLAAALVAASMLAAPAAWAKLPPPPPMDDAAKAAAAEKKAKADAAAAKAKEELAEAYDRVVKDYHETMRKEGKPIPKPTPISAAAAPGKPDAKGAAKDDPKKSADKKS